MNTQPKSSYYVACSPSGYHIFKRGQKSAVLCDLTWEDAQCWLAKLKEGGPVNETKGYPVGFHLVRIWPGFCPR